MVKKKKKKMSAKAKKERKNRIKTGFLGAFITYTILLTVFIGVMFPSLPLDMMKTSHGDFNVDIMGISIKNPYDVSQEVVVFSDSYGRPEIDTSRTSWTTSELTHWDAFGTNPEAPFKPPFIKEYLDVGSIDAEEGWTNAPSTSYNQWSSGNNWYGAESINIDPDSKNSGTPNLGISIANMYPSDSNGNHDETYSHETHTRTLVDPEGNTRDIELHTGFITLELHHTVEADYFLEFAGADTISYLMGEVVGEGRSNYEEWTTFGTGVDFETVYRVSIHSLGFDDLWELNPEWVNVGNGILGLNRRGLTQIEVDGGIFYIATQNTLNWKYDGYNDIESKSQGIIRKFDSKENVLDRQNELVDVGGTVIDFKKQNPHTVYFGLDNYVELGCDWTPAVLSGGMDKGSIQVQKVVWVQQVTIQFYTSITQPLGGAGVDPIELIVEFEDPDEPQGRLWDRLIHWIATALGISEMSATMIVIAVIVVIILIVLVIAFPQIIPAIGKGFSGLFTKIAQNRAKRKASRGN